ncbi:NosD domain-containing protein [Lentzea sp. NPDC006480]|uniref:NosD domain-containing protein n=1 Tax=Lentzea sp. NPDC006480 TaxID=3157176 RepID=UPI0033B24FF1
MRVSRLVSMGWVRRIWPKVARRRLTAALTVGVLVAGLVIVGLTHVIPPIRPRMLPGTAWLPSTAIGMLTLVDGVSARVATNVEVSGPAGDFIAVQSAHSGYAVDAASGYIVGIDGGTLAKSSIRPMADGVGKLAVHLTSGGLLVASRERGLVQAVSLDSSTRIGSPMSLPAPVAALAGGDNMLWAADGSGTLISYDISSGTPNRAVHQNTYPADAKIELAFSGAHPVLVDRTHQSATVLSPVSGEVVRSNPVQIGDRDLVSGSPDDLRLLVVQRASGTMAICPLTADSCTARVVLGKPDADSGPPVESLDHAFVPDHTSGTVHVVDLSNSTVIDTARLFDDDRRFELSVHDDIVYFNDPRSEKAGVIDVAGRIRRINKYDPTKPPTASPTTSATVTNTSRTTISPTPSPSPATNRESVSRGTGPGGISGSEPAPVGQPTAGPPRIVKITTSPEAPEVGQEVTFTAEVAGAAPDSWGWTVRRPGGEVESTASTATFKHVFGSAAKYDVGLTVTTGGFQDTQNRALVVVTPSPAVRCGDIVTADVKLNVDLHCTGPGLIVKGNDIVINLNGHTIAGSDTDVGIDVRDQLNITVRNGTIEHFNKGLQLLHVIDVELIALTIADSAGDGVYTNDLTDTIKVTNCRLVRAGILIRTSSNLTVTDTEFRNSSLGLDGRSTPVVSGSTFIDSNLSYHTNANNGSLTGSKFIRAQIFMREADALMMTGNTLEASTMLILNACRNVTVTKNRFSNGDRAISFNQPESTTGVRITENTFTGNQIGVDASARLTGFDDGMTISGNTFTDNAVAGISLESSVVGTGAFARIEGNTLESNGKRSGGRIDSAGNSINDGIHINSPPGSPVEITGNITRGNADFGIEAIPGTVTDGGGNTSSGNPSGCRGVTCS